MSTPQITLTATLETITGAAAGTTSNPARLRITLCNYGLLLPAIAGTSNLAQIVYEAVSTGGALSVQLWGNDVITPAGTFYQIEVLDGSGNKVQCGAYQFSGTETVDLSTATPIIPNPPVPPTGTFVISFNGRSGTVSLQASDVSGVGGALLSAANVFTANNTFGANVTLSSATALLTIATTGGSGTGLQIGSGTPLRGTTGNGGYIAELATGGAGTQGVLVIFDGTGGITSPTRGSFGPAVAVTAGGLDIAGGKITSLANGTASTDAAAYGQIAGAVSAALPATTNLLAGSGTAGSAASSGIAPANVALLSAANTFTGSSNTFNSLVKLNGSATFGISPATTPVYFYDDSTERMSWFAGPSYAWQMGMPDTAGATIKFGKSSYSYSFTPFLTVAQSGLVSVGSALTIDQSGNLGTTGQINPAPAQTSYAGSTGTLKVSQIMAGSGLKCVALLFQNFTGTGTYNFPTAFSVTAFPAGDAAGLAVLVNNNLSSVQIASSTYTGLVLFWGV